MMKAILAMILLCFVSISTYPKKIASARDISRDFVKVYLDRTFAKTYFYLPHGKSVRIIIEQSSADGPDCMKANRFHKWEKAMEWLDQYAYKEMNLKVPGGFENGKYDKGVYSFNLPATLHNTLYLTTIIFSYHNGKPYISTLIFLDGN